MQREKLYNLHNKAYFNCEMFVYEKKQNPVQLVFAIAKAHRAKFCCFLRTKITE